MTVTVRRAAAVDAPTLARLRYRWRSEERGEDGISRESFVDFYTSWAIDRLASHVAFLVEVDGRAAGMAWLVFGSRAPSPNQLDRRTGDLQAVYVIPELRDAGVGGALLDAILAEARVRELEFLTVHSAQRAVSFYQRAGFTADPTWLSLDLR